MVKCTRFGTLDANQRTVARKLILIEADAPDELSVWPKLPVEHFVCLVVWDAPSRDDVMTRFAGTLLDAGAVYVCAFGSGCERLHDAVDEVIVTTGRESDNDHLIPTTWHTNETLDDALWFALFTAFPSRAYESTCGAIVVVAIHAERWVETLRCDLADPSAFSERVLADVGDDDDDVEDDGGTPVG